MKKPILSVVMPVFNAEKYLQEAIDSILNQTFSDFEFLILNDKSTDGSKAIIEKNAAKDQRIIFIDKAENIGHANIRNEGFEIAKGVFVAQMDADDISKPDRLAKQLEVLTKNPEIGVCGTVYTLFKENGKRELISLPAQHDNIKIAFLFYDPIGNPTVMLRKEVLGNFRFDNDFEPAADYDLWSRLITKTKFYNIQESLLLYRWHSENMSTKQADNVEKSVKKIKANQMTQFGINPADPKIDLYINAFSLKRGLMPAEVIEVIKASEFLLSQNEKLKNFNHDLLEKHINRVLTRTIRKVGKYSISYYNYMRKNESKLFQKINRLDKTILFLKCIIGWKK